MATDLDSIRKTLVSISRGDDILDTLLEFERTLDNLELFAYKNWILGELVEGPNISRYWYTTVWMFPFEMMPDPAAGLRLLKIGAQVSFTQGVFKRPIKVTGPEDWRDPETKKAKMVDSKVWLVTIDLPIKYINRGLEDIDTVIQDDVQKASDLLSTSFDDQDGTGDSEEDYTDGMGADDMTSEDTL